MNDHPPAFYLNIRVWFFKLFSSIIPLFIIMMVVGVISMPIEGGLLPIIILFTFMLVSGIVAAFLLTYFLSVLGKATPAEAGLSAANKFGKRLTIAWTNITRVERKKYLFLDYLVVIGNEKTTEIWLPQPLQNEDDFRRAVIALALEGNPLRKLFELELAQRELLQK